MATIGLQLYTLRDDVARDLRGTLARVGEAGYEGVEGHTLEGADPATVRGWLDGSGLVTAGWHARLTSIEDELDELTATLEALGTTRLTVSWIDPPRTASAADELVARMVAAARRVSERGLSFGFHNHAGELEPLEDGASFLDRLLDTPRDLIALELDLGWIWDAGADPVDVLRRAEGRCPLVHVKDFSARGRRAFAPVGDGAVGYDRVLPAAVAAGAEWLLVEQDETGGPAFDAVLRSLAAVRALLGT